MTAEIIAIGSELLTPFHQDTNSLYLTDQLERLGIAVVQKTVVGDQPDRLRQAFADALKHADLVIGMGGLGPTADDRTREAVAGGPNPHPGDKPQGGGAPGEHG